jgi:hypothetical protein
MTKNDRQAEQTTHECTGRDGQVDRGTEPERQQRCRISTNAEKRGVPQWKLAHVADDEVEARSQHNKEHDQDADVHEIFIAHDQRREHAYQQSHEEGVSLQAHQTPSLRLANSP